MPAGRVAALVGPNGAGETTLLRAVMGLITPPAGRARIFGRPPGGRRALARAAFVAQEKPLYDTLRVAELVRMGRALNQVWDGLRDAPAIAGSAT